MIYEVISSMKHGKYSSSSAGGVICNAVLRDDGLIADKQFIQEAEMYFNMRDGTVNTALDSNWKDRTELFSGNRWWFSNSLLAIDEFDSDLIT